MGGTLVKNVLKKNQYKRSLKYVKMNLLIM